MHHSSYNTIQSSLKLKTFLFNFWCYSIDGNVQYMFIWQSCLELTLITNFNTQLCFFYPIVQSHYFIQASEWCCLIWINLITFEAAWKAFIINLIWQINFWKVSNKSQKVLKNFPISFPYGQAKGSLLWLLTICWQCIWISP